ncbi:MAG: glycosyltransferase family 2 protein [Cyclobacteriaceae bacterium]
MKVSIILSTYNMPQWLEKVLWGYEAQSYKDFEIIVADDGSTQETKSLLKRFERSSTLQIKHVWHPDNGFQKCIILNQAILACSSDYIIFSDGDCIPRHDFIATHVAYAEKGHFLSGGYFKLSMSISEQITKKDINSGNCFQKKWLLSNGLEKTSKLKKLTAQGLTANLMNKITPTTASWNGHNASGWKADFLHINGFNEEMQYGGEDREFGERLINNGIKPKQIRYSAIVVHLDHKRGYVKPAMIEKNNQIRQETKKNKTIKTSYGIRKPN